MKKIFLKTSQIIPTYYQIGYFYGKPGSKSANLETPNQYLIFRFCARLNFR
jgi:hypothetical protein